MIVWIGIELPMRALKVQSYGTHPYLHNRAGTFASIEYASPCMTVQVHTFASTIIISLM